MKLRFKCSCGERFTKEVDDPTPLQVAEEMYNGFVTASCADHEVSE